jgi:hypothetical protein
VIEKYLKSYSEEYKINPTRSMISEIQTAVF